jgi:hypothetical protein
MANSLPSLTQRKADKEKRQLKQKQKQQKEYFNDFLKSERGQIAFN